MDYIQYFGHLTVEVCLNNIISLFNINTLDKIYGEQRLVPSKFDINATKKCDFIFSTDERIESCQPEIIERLVQRTHAIYISPKPALDKVQLPFKNKIEVKEGEVFNIKGLEIEVTKASQPRAIYPVGFVLKNKYKVYYAGQSYKFTQIGSIKCDIAILPIKGTQTMDYFDAAESCKELRPKIVIPIAYENNLAGLDDLKEFSKILPSYVKTIILKPGQIAKLP
ncbi:MAG: MBL fold metallo-hydrolase [Candidatus Omnitrophica bacterium]|nr:MBL fold metallo-hydrolase [Candidatus Omnitrophota bacterium]